MFDLRSICSVCLLISATSMAGEADVVKAESDCDAETCTFRVSVRHDDTGWDHYADHWAVLDPDGKEIGRRILLHPHETEQPFTRSLSGVHIPTGITQVTIQAHDSVHEYGGEVLVLDVR